MKISLITAESVSEITYPKTLEVVASPKLLTQYAQYVQSAIFVKAGHTKTRGEVRGGGKKPWRQKGTGRARHGSTRSPIWVGGGITFGPRRDQERDVRMNTKMRRKAFFGLLTDAANNKRVAVADFAAETSPKTIREKLLPFINDDKAYLVVTDRAKSILKGAANIKNVELVSVNRFGYQQLHSNAKVIVEKDSFDALEERGKKL